MEMTLHTTEFTGGKVNASQGRALFAQDTEGVEKNIINIYPEVGYQTIDGFGGAVTESACFALSKLPSEKRNEVLEGYFGKSGIGYSFLRTHIDSCDFSLGHYSAVEDESDTALKSFSVSRDEELIIPTIKQAQELYGKPIDVLLTPWSPPAFMKTNGERNNGGSLKKEYYPLWAEYICRYVEAYQAHGVGVSMLTIQNEPKAVQIWDSCVYTAQEERAFLRDHLHPALVRHGLGGLQVYIWDHNKERVFERACELIGPDTDEMIGGIAFHWYSGDHFEALRMTREQFPAKKLMFSEGCVEIAGANVAAGSELQNAQQYAHDIIGNLNNGMNLFLDWNIALDERGGPNHVGNFCDAPVRCDTAAGTYTRNLSFYYIGHFSRYIRPGARTIGFSRYTDDIEVAAAKNTDGSLVAVLLNKSSQPRDIVMRIQEKTAAACIPAASITTALIV
jgi:glucosylceramidase